MIDDTNQPANPTDERPIDQTPVDGDRTLTSPDGDELSLSQIGLGALHGDLSVETVVAGEEYLVDGTRYTSNTDALADPPMAR